jgi:hypothetical protein
MRIPTLSDYRRYRVTKALLFVADVAMALCYRYLF